MIDNAKAEKLSSLIENVADKLASMVSDISKLRGIDWQVHGDEATVNMLIELYDTFDRNMIQQQMAFQLASVLTLAMAKNQGMGNAR